MGYRIFAFMDNQKKLELCARIMIADVLIMPHTADTILCTGHNITISLHTLTRYLLQCGITSVGYGMKSPYRDLIELRGLTPPTPSVICRYDFGRVVSVDYIPLFGLEENVRGTVYPMLNDFGEGAGSVELSLKCARAKEVKMKVYPHIIHYLKAMGIIWRC